VLRWYADTLQGKGIARLHFCLPYAPKANARGKSHQFEAGVIRLDYTVLIVLEVVDGIPKGEYSLLIPEAQIDVDSSCLALLGIFSDEDLDSLQKAFPVKRGASAKHTWQIIESAPGAPETIEVAKRTPNPNLVSECGETYMFCTECSLPCPMDEITTIPRPSANGVVVSYEYICIGCNDCRHVHKAHKVENVDVSAV